MRLVGSLWTPQELGRIDGQRVGDLTQHRDAGRHVGPFDRPDIAGAQSGAGGQLFLRNFLVMTYTTQIDRHGLFEIHDLRGTCIGMIVPGTIIPIRSEMWYSVDAASRSGTPRDVLAIAGWPQYDASGASVRAVVAALYATQIDRSLQ